MNEQILRPSHMAAAAVVIAGGLVAIAPQHAASVVRLMLVTVAAATALYALVVNAPARWWRSPFDRGVDAVAGRGPGSGELGRLRLLLRSRRQRIAGGPALPPEVLRMLQPQIRTALDARGVELRRGEDDVAAARGLLSPVTFAILVADPLDQPRWRNTVRGDERASADVVHHALDELDRLGAERAGRHPNLEPGAS